MKPTLHKLKYKKHKQDTLKTPQLLSLSFTVGLFFDLRNLTYQFEGGYIFLKKNIVSSYWDIRSQHSTSGILWLGSASLIVCLPLKGWNVKLWDDRMFLTWVLLFHILNSTVRAINLDCIRWRYMSLGSYALSFRRGVWPCIPQDHNEVILTFKKWPQSL